MLMPMSRKGIIYNQGDILNFKTIVSYRTNNQQTGFKKKKKFQFDSIFCSTVYPWFCVLVFFRKSSHLYNKILISLVLLISHLKLFNPL